MDALIAALHPIILAGLMGGFVRWLVFRESWTIAIPNILGGGIVAHYTTEAIVTILLEYMNKTTTITDPVINTIISATAFLIGFFGMFILTFAQETIVTYTKRKLKEPRRENP